MMGRRRRGRGLARPRAVISRFRDQFEGGQGEERVRPGGSGNMGEIGETRPRSGRLHPQGNTPYYYLGGLED